MSTNPDSTPPQPTGSLKQFEALIGQWTTVGTHPMIPNDVHGQSTFEWLKDGALLVWRFEWEPGQPVPSAYSIIGHDDEGGPGTMLYTDVRGVARIYKMTLDDGVWKMWRESADFAQRMTGTFSADGQTITWQGEMQRKGAAWEPDLRVVFTRKA